MQIHLKLFNTYSKLDCDSPLPDNVFRELRQELSYVSGNYNPSLFAKRPGIGWCFPTGLLSQVAPLLRKYYDVDILDYRKHVENSDAQYVWNPDIKLHPYQHEAAALAVEKTRGIVYAGTGGGKTRISARTIFKLQKKAFVVVINSLAWQDTYEAYRSYFQFADIGVWAGDKKEIGDITIVTIQALTMANKSNNALWKAFIQADIVMLDEIHTTAGPGAWGQCILDSPAYYKFGLSGTPYRGREEDDILLRAATGKVFFKKMAVELQEENFLAQSKIIFHRFDTSKESRIYSPDYETAIVNNVERNKFITEIALRSKLVTAISVTQIKHAEILSDMTGYLLFHGQETKKAKAAIRDGLKAGDIPGVVATSILTASADYPPLKRFIDASAGRSRNAVIQKKGRALRLFEGELAEYHGIMDEFNDIYRNNARDCVSHFEKEGWVVEYA